MKMCWNEFIIATAYSHSSLLDCMCHMFLVFAWESLWIHNSISVVVLNIRVSWLPDANSMECCKLQESKYRYHISRPKYNCMELCSAASGEQRITGRTMNHNSFNLSFNLSRPFHGFLYQSLFVNYSTWHRSTIYVRRCEMFEKM